MIAKTERDITSLREGGKRLAHHVRVLGEMVAPGVFVADLEKRARELIEKYGDRSAFMHYPSGKRNEKFPGVLCVSINDAIVHGPAAIFDYEIREGDVISVDFGIVHDGLFTDHAATVVAGAASKREEELVRGTYEALGVGIAAAQCGKRVGDIGYAVEQIAKKYKFGFPKNLAGHGVGRSVHEDPQVPNFGTIGTGAELVEGLVIAIEPMMTLGSGDLFVDKDAFTYRTKDGSKSAHAEHTVMITKVGPEILTKE